MEQNILIEIKAAEGGNDAKLLVKEMAIIYHKVAQRHFFTVTSESRREGFHSL